MKFFTLALLLLLTSCATRKLSVDISLPRGQYNMSPETVEKDIYFGAGVHAVVTNSVELGGTSQSQELFSSSPGSVEINQESSIDTSLGLGATGHIGLFKYFEIIAGGVTQYVFEGGLKVCPFYNCSPENNGFKFAVYGLMGYGHDSESSTDSFFSSDDDKGDYANVSAFAAQRTKTLGLILGYRRDEKQLFMLNLSHTSDDVESKVDIQGGSSFSLDSKIDNSSALASVRLNQELFNNKTTYFQIDVGYNKLRQRGQRGVKNHDGFSGALGLGVAAF